MTRVHAPFANRYAAPIGRRQQRGVVLFIALLVMVVLMMAGIALIRSTDTATVVSGNLTLEQAANSAADRSIEYSVHALFDTTLISDRTNDDLAQNYYASVGRNPDDSIPEIPKALQEPFSASAFAGAGLSDSLIAVDDAGNKTYHVIERLCLASGPPVGSQLQPVQRRLRSRSGDATLYGFDPARRCLLSRHHSHRRPARYRQLCASHPEVGRNLRSNFGLGT